MAPDVHTNTAMKSHPCQSSVPAGMKSSAARATMPKRDDRRARLVTSFISRFYHFSSDPWSHPQGEKPLILARICEHDSRIISGAKNRARTSARWLTTSGYKNYAMAATNKSLAQMNKTRDVGKATKTCSALTR